MFPLKLLDGRMPYATGLMFRDNSPMVYDSGDYPATQDKAVAPRA